MTDEKLPPMADLTEALARAQDRKRSEQLAETLGVKPHESAFVANARRLWPVLHAVDTPHTEPANASLWWVIAGLLLLAGASMGRC